MEYWSIEKKDIKPLAITPSLHYSNTPKLIENKIFEEILPCFVYRLVIFRGCVQLQLKFNSNYA